jgi:hypothetical protein
MGKYGNWITREKIGIFILLIGGKWNLLEQCIGHQVMLMSQTLL